MVDLCLLFSATLKQMYAEYITAEDWRKMLRMSLRLCLERILPVKKSRMFI